MIIYKKIFLWPHIWEIYGQDTIFQQWTLRINQTFKKIFFKTLYEVTKRDIAVSVCLSKQRINE